MTPQEFTYWLQGALEVNPDMLKDGMTPEQVQTVQDHLNLVFNKVTPDRFRKEKTDIPEIKKENLEVKSEEITFHPFPGTPGGTYNDGAICAGGSDWRETMYC